VRVLLFSSYELGHQPLGVARVAADLAPAGHEIRSCDLAVEPWPEADLAWCEAAAFAVPMHTALRLALASIDRCRTTRPDLRVALHGLYAGVVADDPRFSARDLVSADETGAPLVDWLDRLDPPRRPEAGEPPTPPQRASAPRTHPRRLLPLARAGLPPLDRYARLLLDGEERLAGAVEATLGCSHRCRHCPVPVVYDGRSTPVPLETVLSDIESLVEAGAGHVSFSDPDFLNRPQHARRVARALADSWPELTFDITVKVEHILRQAEIWTEMAQAGCLFVVSALESTNDAILELLDKGHTAREAVGAIDLLRAAGIEPRPSFLPFTPWTRVGDLVTLLQFIADNDLIWNVDPVQYGIRLLLPPGSLLLRNPDPILAASLVEKPSDRLSHDWVSPDPAVDALQSAIARWTEQAAARAIATDETYAGVCSLVREAARTPSVAGSAARATAAPRRSSLPTPKGPAAPIEPVPAGRQRPRRRTSSPWPVVARPGRRPGPGRPRLSEAWFCCAEPTTMQLNRIDH